MTITTEQQYQSANERYEQIKDADFETEFWDEKILLAKAIVAWECIGQYEAEKTK